MSNEVEDAEKYIKRVTKSLDSCSDAKRIKVLSEKVQFWYMAAQLCSNAFKDATREEVIQ